ncbi:fasciclin domain-containing protein [Falsiruegeria mediterranea]|uniref:Bifunctional hemolysin/adenylate cyclase n=1 Tax=Falsiruegeria mediterranea M17 TaxID=1200281 RepID=A0A2R8C965_9RHOB|nr:fasciclin domain-containing protein [Falsiruegeria mediterranea]SPJ28938.1 Bifunctional hemolysin/adenylate cyclase [Falsiruegeria mediterranea M17]
MVTIKDVAIGSADLSILVNVLQFLDDNIENSALVDTVGDAGNDLTVFAPTNAAFSQLATDLGFMGDPDDQGAVIGFLAGNVPVETLNAVVLYHVSAGAQSAMDIAANGTVTTLQGGTISTGSLPTLQDVEPDLLDPTLISTDNFASNGVVHIIDRVLLPVDLPGNDVPSITGTVVAASGAAGFDDNGGDFDLLREAVTAANLAGSLDAPGDFTVFAPNDAAFVGLSQALGYGGGDEAGALTYILDSLRLLSAGEDPIDLLSTVLTYHVAGESLQSSQVIAAGQVTTLQTGTLTVDGTSLVDADPDIPNPNLIALDIQASNGIVHVLDGVLIPADLLQSDGSNDVDFIIGDDTDQVLATGADNDLIDGRGGRDEIDAGAGNDIVLGGDGNDIIRGGTGDDTLKGEGGNDWFVSVGGNNIIAGGDGFDFITYADVSVGVQVNTASGQANNGNGIDTFNDVEGITGSSQGDTFTTGDGANYIRGLGGRDVFDFSEGGSHVAVGGAGADLVTYLNADEGVEASLLRGRGYEGDRYSNVEYLQGSDFDDQLSGDRHNNYLLGENGDDVLVGAAGNDLISGGLGTDTAVYFGNRSDYSITLTGNQARVEFIGATGGDGTDLLVNVEVLSFADGDFIL